MNDEVNNTFHEFKNRTVFELLDQNEHDHMTTHRTATTNQTLRSLMLTNNYSNHISTSMDSSLGDHNFRENDLDDDDYDSLEYQFSSYGCKALEIFKEFIQKLNNLKYLKFILYNWIIGNQLVIKYNNNIINQELIRAFASVFRVRK